ncbi:MAG: hypothetical protein U0640_01140 [Phycisphaerales bacterium]|jgi:hypothetical protein
MNNKQQQQQPNGKAGQNNKPVFVSRFGAIKAVVWLNQTSVGPIHNVTVARSYKDGEDWKESGSFGTDDLLTLAKALNAAHTWICEQRQRPEADAA